MSTQTVLSVKASAEQAAPEEEAGPGAWTTSNRPPPMFSLRFGPEERRSYPYDDLRGIQLQGERLRLYFMQATVTLTGRNMEALADHIERHTVGCVRQRHRSAFLLARGDDYIERIEIGPPDPEGLMR